MEARQLQEAQRPYTHTDVDGKSNNISSPALLILHVSFSLNYIYLVRSSQKKAVLSLATLLTFYGAKTSDDIYMSCLMTETIVR